jgi:DNA-binding MarR family transcriptional regulator
MNEEFDRLRNALLGASHLLLRHPLCGEPEAAALLVLSVACARASSRPSDLAAAMRLDLSTISRHVRDLEAERYVAKVKDAHDGRSYRLEVTAAGRAALQEAGARRAELFRRATAHWPRKDFRTLVALLERLAADLKASAEAQGRG